jgi:glycosyltransferase involved in cell wall biosynthesis
MKVLHLSSEKSWRGGEQQMAYLIEELTKLGVQSYVAVRRKSEFLEWCKQAAIPYTELSFKNDFDFFSAISLKKYCRKEKFDLIHLHSSRGHGIAFLSALLGNNIAMVLSRRVDFPLKHDFFSSAKYNHPAIKKIICVSKKIKQIVSGSIKHPDRCVIVYDGVDLLRFKGKGVRELIRNELSIRNDAFFIGNIAALAPHKDYFTFLETAKILSENKSLKFVIVGDGALRNEIEIKIEDLKLKDKVLILGFRKDLENVYASLDLLLYTSKEEGLGSTLLDAMAYGVPIVATEAGGIPEIVINERTGLTAPVQDAKRLAEQVMRLINNVPLRQKLITNAEIFAKDFSKEKMATKTFEIYKQITN